MIIYRKEKDMIITLGTIMFFGGILGMAICMITLLILPRIFEKQKRKFFEQMDCQQ